MSLFNKKIDEWMKEAEERPASAIAIVKLVARSSARTNRTQRGVAGREYRSGERHARG
jgi:hypothetical protein